MDCFKRLIGNKRNRELFSSQIESGTLSHAYLVVGPGGSGKKTLANCIACKLAETTGGSDEIGRIQGGTCPDVVLARKEDDKKTFGVDPVREVISTVNLSPSILDFKVYIFDEADLLTVQAQNALLKVIEEPPENTYFFLLCKNVSSIIPTVRSRVQTVFMELLNRDEIWAYLIDNGIFVRDEQKCDFVMRLSEGTLGKARVLAEDESEYEFYKTVSEIVRMQSRKGENKYIDFILKVNSVAGTREKLGKALDYLLMAYRDILVAKNESTVKTSFFDENTAGELAERYADATIQLSLSAITKIRNGLNFNTNLNTTSVFLAQQLWSSY